MIETYSVGLVANVPVRVNAQGAFYRLIDGAAVDVTFFSNGAVVGRASGMNGGFYARAKEGTQFDAVELVSATAQTSKSLIGTAEAGAANAVSVSGTVATAEQGLAVNMDLSSVYGSPVGTANANIFASNPARKFLMMQNRSDTAKITVRLFSSGTLTDGFILYPGQVLILDRIVPTGAINVSSDIAGTSFWAHQV